MIPGWKVEERKIVTEEENLRVEAKDALLEREDVGRERAHRSA